jgi:hypothetical protein
MTVMAKKTRTLPWAVIQKLKGQSPHKKLSSRAQYTTPNEAAAHTSNKAAVSHRKGL